MSIKETEKKKKIKTVDVTFFLDVCLGLLQQNKKCFD